MSVASHRTSEHESTSHHILFLPDNPYDVETAREVFTAYDVHITAVQSLAALIENTDDTVDCLLLVEEALQSPHFDRLKTFLEQQPAWSDLPLIITTRSDSKSHRAWQLIPIANITLVERPLPIRTLISLVLSALRDRLRQYEIRQSITNRDHFMAMVGHELRNPLTSISLALQLLDDTEHPVLEILHTQTENLKRIVDDLRELGRITRGELAFDKTHVDLVELTKETTQAFIPIATNQSMTLEIDLPDSPIWIYGDLVRLRQVLGNLLSNAIRYTPEEGYIHVRARSIGETATVTVSDSGIGIPPEDLDHIFDLFTQAHRDTTGSREGLGLGLSLANSIVLEHGGELIADSPGRGMGSTFSLHLPLSDPPTEATEDRPPSASR